MGSELILRRLLAISYCGPVLLYTDDGELQDARRMPYIDFLRDSAAEIEDKIKARGRAAILALGGEAKILSDGERHREIGALVERLVDGLGYVQMERETDANGEAGMYDVRSHDASAYTDTLLDALRALAAECQIPEKP